VIYLGLGSTGFFPNPVAHTWNCDNFLPWPVPNCNKSARYLSYCRDHHGTNNSEQNSVPCVLYSWHVTT